MTRPLSQSHSLSSQHSRVCAALPHHMTKLVAAMKEEKQRRHITAKSIGFMVLRVSRVRVNNEAFGQNQGMDEMMHSLSRIVPSSIELLAPVAN